LEHLFNLSCILRETSFESPATKSARNRWPQGDKNHTSLIN
jgi:hypothetical protein